MLKLGAAPITPSLFWLPVMVYAPGPGIVSHSYGRLPLSGGMLRHQREPRLGREPRRTDTCAAQGA